MGFPDSILTSDERVVLHLRPHWKKLIPPVFWLVLVPAAFVAAAVLWNGTALLVLAVVALALLAWLALWPWLAWRSTHYVFTTERVLTRVGVLTRRGHDIPLSRINDVSFSHSIFERMVGSGTMTIESAGERGQVVLVDLPRVEHTQGVLYELVEAEAEQRRHAAAQAAEAAAAAAGGGIGGAGAGGTAGPAGPVADRVIADEKPGPA